MNKYQVLLDYVNSGTAILTAGKIHDNIPTIHDIGHNLPIDSNSEVRHVGFGFFEAKVNDDCITFDGGGAMNRLTDNDRNNILSWCILGANSGQLESMGYNLESVKSALESFNS